MPIVHNMSIRAILLGLLVDVGGSLVFGLLFVLLETGVIFAKGADPTILLVQMQSDKTSLVANLLVGLLFSFWGGFVAARVAKTRELLHAGSVGALSLLWGTALLTVTRTYPPAWYLGLSYPLVIPTALLAGQLAKRRRLRTHAA